MSMLQAVSDAAEPWRMGESAACSPAGKQVTSETGTAPAAEAVSEARRDVKLDQSRTRRAPRRTAVLRRWRNNAAVLSDSRRHTRRSFVVAVAAATAGYGRLPLARPSAAARRCSRRDIEKRSRQMRRSPAPFLMSGRYAYLSSLEGRESSRQRSLWPEEDARTGKLSSTTGRFRGLGVSSTVQSRRDCLGVRLR